LTNEAPLAGLRVVEVALGTSTVGAGVATSLPGSLLRDFGAGVARVQSRRRSSLDAGVGFERAWDHGKEVVTVDDDDAPPTVTALARDADVLFVAGDEAAVEGGGLGSRQLCRTNPRLVAVRIRPSWDAGGTVRDLELLVAARAGLLTQIRSHHGGPAFPDLPVATTGAALAATVGALACLYERESTGKGGWAETSLADGLRALLPMITGRVEHPSATTDLLWRGQGPAEALSYRCADGEYVQLWFGAKGAYEAFLEHVGDPPSERGYNADLVSGAMVERGERWAAMFATRERAFWLDDLSGRDFRCEPVLRPGEALKDAHVREVGLTLEHDGTTVVGPPVCVTRVGRGAPPVDRARGLLDGVRVVDLSAYLAGPITPLVLAELGADVVKVEPPTGDAHRNMEPMFAAGQRGKRALALDLKAPDAARVLERLFRWTDVVHHNSRVGLAERLGYDEATVRAANPDVVYSFASGFGDSGPRARLPTNDQLMQALAGVESAQGGAGRPPTYLVWGAVDVTGGWLAACGVLAGLYARRARGGGQSVRSSLLGAGLTLKSGAFLAGDTVVPGPVLDADQRGYGAAYRLYQGGDGEWFALAVPDEAAWSRLRRVVDLDSLPDLPPPLRTDGARQPAEEQLEQAFAREKATTWIAALRDADVPVEPVAQMTRSEFVDAFLDDPVNRQLGRVVAYQWGDRGLLEQPALPVRFGPAPRPHAPTRIPALGEHTEELFAALGVGSGAGTVAAAEPGSTTGLLS
jgi:crotonobetainyl-CoA:carnitine CoA-transferase CaiB-like acyl-CoA transferase